MECVRGSIFLVEDIVKYPVKLVHSPAILDSFLKTTGAPSVASSQVVPGTTAVY
jgi:hypothetical protein